MTTFDLRPLRAPIDRSALSDFTARTRRTWPTWLHAIMLTVAGIVYGGMLLFIVVGLVTNPFPVGYGILAVWLVIGVLAVYRLFTNEGVARA